MNIAKMQFFRIRTLLRRAASVGFLLFQLWALSYTALAADHNKFDELGKRLNDLQADIFDDTRQARTFFDDAKRLGYPPIFGVLALRSVVGTGEDKNDLVRFLKLSLDGAGGSADLLVAILLLRNELPVAEREHLTQQAADVMQKRIVRGDALVAIAYMLLTSKSAATIQEGTMAEQFINTQISATFRRASPVLGMWALNNLNLPKMSAAMHCATLPLQLAAQYLEKCAGSEGQFSEWKRKARKLADTLEFNLGGAYGPELVAKYKDVVCNQIVDELAGTDVCIDLLFATLTTCSFHNVSGHYRSGNRLFCRRQDALAVARMLGSEFEKLVGLRLLKLSQETLQ